MPWYAPKDLVIRTTTDPGSLVPALPRIIHEADPDQPVSDVTPLADREILRKPDQPVRLDERQRADENVVDDGIRRGRGADAQRGDSDCGNRKAQRAAERTERVAKILAENIPLDRGRGRDRVRQRLDPEREHRQNTACLAAVGGEHGAHFSAVLGPPRGRVKVQKSAVEPHHAGDL